MSWGGGGEVVEMKIMDPQHTSQKLREYKTNITLSSKDLTHIQWTNQKL